MNLKHGAKAADWVAADTNVLLSAIIGKAALKVFNYSQIEVVSTTFNIQEVWEHLPHMAENHGFAPELLASQFGLLAVKEFGPRDYHGSLALARRKIGKRDPEDVDLLALALELEIPLWSNDGDFEGTGIEWYTTAQLLKKLGL
jgi:predicted nucleic acid-binding protein